MDCEFVKSCRGGRLLAKDGFTFRSQRKGKMYWMCYVIGCSATAVTSGDVVEKGSGPDDHCHRLNKVSTWKRKFSNCVGGNGRISATTGKKDLQVCMNKLRKC